jgi:outer membrane lipopolysaccharide assembly protein LptE/RlpB
MKNNIQSFLFLSMITLVLQACSSNGFHLRESTSLSGVYEKIALQGLAEDSDLYSTLEEAIIEAGGSVVSTAMAGSTIAISNLKEDKKIIAYTSKRIAREYMVYLHFDYQIKVDKMLKKRLIRLDKTLIYDANFVLGKAEEEQRIQQSLREEAARLILLGLRYK